MATSAPTPLRSTRTIRPTPSTWPCTRWPPSRVASVTGRSRFTVSPSSSRPSVVRDSVSGERSNASRSASRSTTVRQTPFTDTDAPTGESAVTVSHRTTIRPLERARTSPSSSTIPVNIGLDPHVRADALHVGHLQLYGIVDRHDSLALDDPGRVRAAHDLRREVQDHLVDEPAGDGAPRERGPALEQRALHVSLPEIPEQLAQRHALIDRLEEDRIGAGGPPRVDAFLRGQLRRGDERGSLTREELRAHLDPA